MPAGGGAEQAAVNSCFNMENMSACREREREGDTISGP